MTPTSTPRLPAVGETLPSFSLPAALAGKEEKVLSDQDFTGSPWVLFVYPKDATSGCTIEVCEFRELAAEFDKLKVKLVGLSRDKLSAHHKFIANQNLPYPLLSDAEQELLRGWNLIAHKTMYGKPVTKVLRTTFVMDGKNKVLNVFENVSAPGHARAVLEFLQSLR